VNSERWQRIGELVEQALAQPESARLRFLGRACGGDVELRDEVISLIEAPVADELPPAWLDAVAGPEPARFTAGDRIAGRYLVHALIGRGGMGEVYEALDEELAITVALKTLRHAGGGEEALQRLRLEGLLARAVWHPNVCRVYDLGRHGDGPDTVWFLTMERLHGPTLADRLREGRLPLDRVLRLVEHMSAGIGAAHQAGVVHRDFKPDNVMLVDRDGAEQAVVTDFGTARAARAEPCLLGDSGAIIGTPAYMAPEQVRGEEGGPAADVYALGLVLYEMVTGAPPFAGGTPLEIARRRLVEDAPPARSLVPGLDDRWEAVIRRCLAREPRHRFARAEEVADALAGRAPPIATETLEPGLRGRHTLPAERDPFVGRGAELEELGRHLSDSRLVTLVGAGGMGKTRLAVRHGWRSLGRWSGGVWFCDLTEARDRNGVASTLAVSLGVPIGRGDPIEQLGHAIAGRGRCLLILDNFEQVVEHAADTLGRWWALAPESRWLVTTRERLNLAGECVQWMEPLSLESGVELFDTRARGLRPALAPTAAEAEAAREIVRLVDGMPLAIELAAARIRVMSATQIVDRMRKRFQLLTGGRGTRHETLAGAIDGSWELLAPGERSAWAQCSVFEGGFTLPAAHAVLDLGDGDVIDVLRSLADKSLLRTWVPAPGPGEDLPEARFGMYVSLHEYARARLAELVARAAFDPLCGPHAAEERHGRWYARYGAVDAIEALERPGGATRRRELERDLDNLMVACQRALERGDGVTAMSAYRASWAVLEVRGPFAGAVDLGRAALESNLDRGERGELLGVLAQAESYAGMMEEAAAHAEASLGLAHAAGDRSRESRALSLLGFMLNARGRPKEACASLELALAAAREVGDRSLESNALNSLCTVHREGGRMDEADACSESALAAARAATNQRLESAILGNLGILRQKQGRSVEARECYQASLTLNHEVGDRRQQANLLGNLATLNFEQGRLDEARSLLEQVRAIFLELGLRGAEGVALSNLSHLNLHQGRMDEARTQCEAALAIHRQVGNRRMEAAALETLGRTYHERGEIDLARGRFEEALAVVREVGDPRYEGSLLVHLARLLATEGLADLAGDALNRAEALLRDLGDRHELALLLCARAELDHGTGNQARARAALGEAETLAAAVGAGPASELGQRLSTVRAALA
jgi:predicted ATPase